MFVTFASLQIAKVAISSYYINSAMIEYILSLFIVFMTYLVYVCCWRPHRIMKWYKNKLESLGYRVKYLPFEPFKISTYEKEFRIYGDSLHTAKTEYYQYDVGIFNFFNYPFIGLINPELIKQFCCNDHLRYYPKMGSILSLMKAGLGDGLLFSEGEDWKRKRKILSKAFNFEMIILNIPKIVEICSQALETFEEQSREANKKNGEQTEEIRFNTFDFGSHVSCGVMMRCFFGHSFAIGQTLDKLSPAKFIVNLLNQAMDISSNDPIVAIFGPKVYEYGLRHKYREFRRKIQILKQLALQVIEKRTKQILALGSKKISTDLLEALITAKQEKEETFDKQELVEEFKTFLNAGTDTTATFLMSMIKYVGKNPQVEKKMRQVINETIKNDMDITYENLKKMEYLEWVQNQTMRIAAPINFALPRQPTEDHYLKDIPITKNIGISTDIFGSHFNQKYFPKPFEFRPERWASECKDIHSYALGGFMGGPRSCIGKSLAYLSNKIMMIKLIKRYDSFQNDEKDTRMIRKFMYGPVPFETIFKKTSETIT